MTHFYSILIYNVLEGYYQYFFKILLLLVQQRDLLINFQLLINYYELLLHLSGTIKLTYH
jgi:hypothetical protein